MVAPATAPLRRRRAAAAVVLLAACLSAAGDEPAGAKRGPGRLDDPAALPGQIIVDPHNPAWLKYNGGSPVHLCGPGDPEGFLYRGRRRPDGTRDGDQLALIRKLIAHGGNCIYMQVVRSHGGDGRRDHNPFVGADPARGLSQPLLDQWAKWFALMDAHGICIYLFFYDDGVCLWGRRRDDVPPEERRFLEGIVRRFRDRRHLIWAVAEESEEAFSHRRVRAIADVIRKADARHHVIADHHHSGTTFKAFVPGCALTQFAIQYNKSTAAELHAGVLDAWRKAKGRYNLNMSEAAGHMHDMRAKNWACAMAGAHVMVIKMDIAGTPPADLHACRIQQRFFESTDVNTMSPHDELAHGGSRYVLADPGRSYIVYGKGAGQVGLKKMSAGTYDFTWIDCAAGKTVSQRGVRVAAGDRTWPTPAGIGAERAVWLRRSPARP